MPCLEDLKKNSDDILEFVVGPCIDSAEFWADINKTVFYNGYVASIKEWLIKKGIPFTELLF